MENKMILDIRVKNINGKRVLCKFEHDDPSKFMPEIDAFGFITNIHFSEMSWQPIKSRQELENIRLNKGNISLVEVKIENVGVLISTPTVRFLSGKIGNQWERVGDLSSDCFINEGELK